MQSLKIPEIALFFYTKNTSNRDEFLREKAREMAAFIDSYVSPKLNIDQFSSTDCKLISIQTVWDILHQDHVPIFIKQTLIESTFEAFETMHADFFSVLNWVCDSGDHGDLSIGLLQNLILLMKVRDYGFVSTATLKSQSQQGN
jgi:hypothetical protein